MAARIITDAAAAVVNSADDHHRNAKKSEEENRAVMTMVSSQDLLMLSLFRIPADVKTKRNNCINKRMENVWASDVFLTLGQHNATLTSTD